MYERECCSNSVSTPTLHMHAASVIVCVSSSCCPAVVSERESCEFGYVDDNNKLNGW